MPIHPLAEQVKHLHEQGVGRNEIARQLNVTTRQVDNAARELGLSFSREAVREAAEARIRDAQLEREVLAADFRKAARVNLDKLFSSTDLDPAEARELIQAASLAASADARLGRLQIEAQKNRVMGSADSNAAGDFAELVATIRAGNELAPAYPDDDDLRQQVADEGGESFEGVDPSVWEDDAEDQG